MKRAGKPYVEPDDFIPEDIRRELKIGEFAEEKEDTAKENARANKQIRDFVNDK